MIILAWALVIHSKITMISTGLTWQLLPCWWWLYRMLQMKILSRVVHVATGLLIFLRERQKCRLAKCQQRQVIPVWAFCLSKYKENIGKNKHWKGCKPVILPKTLFSFFSCLLCDFLRMLYNKKVDADLFLRPWRNWVGSWFWRHQRK